MAWAKGTWNRAVTSCGAALLLIAWFWPIPGPVGAQNQKPTSPQLLFGEAGQAGQTGTELQLPPIQLGPWPAQAVEEIPVAPKIDIPGGWPGQQMAQVYPINLATALRLTQTNNLEIAHAQQVVAQARANLERARAMVLPTPTIGSTFVDHEGNIQQAIGNILHRNRNSLWVGGGPTLALQFNEALFTPLAANQVLTATQAGFQRVSNDTTMMVVDAYMAILRARRRLARVDTTLEFLTENKPSPRRGDAKGLLPLIRDFVKAGDPAALKADMARVEVEVLKRQEEGRIAMQEMLLATAELARLLRLDPKMILWPMESNWQPLPLPGESWVQADVETLMATALRNRPELAENEAMVQAALNRWRSAWVRPFVPAVVLNYQSGWFGGSPNYVHRTPGRGQGIGLEMTGDGRIDYFGHRADFDVGLMWRVANMGLGNHAEIREQRALHEQARVRLLQAQNRVGSQVVQALEMVQSTQQRLTLTRSALFDAKGDPIGPVFVSLQLNFARIRNVEKTRALEVMDSIRGLSDLLEAYAHALTEQERAHFRMLQALGVPAQQWWNEANIIKRD